jgi:hypothetical protein
MDIRSKKSFREISDAINRAGETYGVHVHNDAKPLYYGSGKGYRGRVIAESSRVRGARRSWSGRRTNAACWHAYRDCMYAVFAIDPNAVIVTAMARYDGLAGFEKNYPETANHNIGSMVQHAYMPDLCECGESD